MGGTCRWVVAFAAVAAGGTSLGQERKDAAGDVQKQLQGTWKFVSQDVDGRARTKDELAKQTITFDGDKWTVRRDGKVVQAGTHKFDPDQKPPQVDAVVTEGEDKGNTMLGIYELKADALKVCFDPTGKERPADFTGKAGRMKAVVEREKK